MKKMTGALLAFTVVAFIGVSCAPHAVGTDITPEKPIHVTTESAIPVSLTHWWTTWLEEPACAPPCWEEITPGITAQEDVLNILNDMSGVTITYNDPRGIDWRFKSDITEGGFLHFTQNGIVAFIVLGSSRYAKPTLEAVTASYGYPAHVQPFDCRDGMCSTALVYSDLGMLLEVFVKDMAGNNLHRVEIQPDIQVNRFLFFPPGLDSYKQMPEYQEYDDLLMEWKGYGKYP